MIGSLILIILGVYSTTFIFIGMYIKDIGISISSIIFFVSCLYLIIDCNCKWRNIPGSIMIISFIVTALYWYIYFENIISFLKNMI